MKPSDLFLRSFFILTLLIKASLTLTQGVFYRNAVEFSNWKVLITKSPGTFVSVFYSFMLWKWCEIVGKYFGGTTEKKFRICKIIVIVTGVVFLILEISFIIVPFKNYELGRKCEDYVSVCRDSVLLLYYVGFVIFIRKSFQIPCTFSRNSQEQLIYVTSVFVFISLMTRTVSFLCLQNKSLSDECGKLFLFMFSLKELIGRTLPLGFITITDYHYNNCDNDNNSSSVLAEVLAPEI